MKLTNQTPFTPTPNYGDDMYETPGTGADTNATAISLYNWGQYNINPFNGKWPRNYATQSGDLQPVGGGKVLIVTR